MRVLVRNIYRAFPELDRYSDDRCERFVAAARRGLVRRAFHYAIIGAVFLVGLAGSAAGCAFLVDLVERHADRMRHDTPALMGLTMLVCAPVVAVGPLLAILVRDLLLRRRIRYVLRARGSCPMCRYSLIGLPVGATGNVTCPECGLEAEVDPSLGELALDDDGRARYRPSPAMLPKPARIFTPTRLRRLKKVSIWSAVVLAFCLPLLWGGYEVWLRHQAAVAARERPGAEGLIEFAEKNQPAGMDSSAGEAWWEFTKAQRQITLTDARVWRGFAPGGGPAPNAVVPDFSMVFARPDSRDPSRAADDAAALAVALKCLDAYRADGVFDQLAKMAACPRAVAPMTFASGPALGVLLPELGEARNVARINVARMKLAADAGDLKGFTEALEQNMALVRMCRQQPFLIQGLTGLGIESMTYARLRDLLMTHPSPAWLDAMDAALARQACSVTPDRVFEGERLCTMDNVAWVFSDPDRVRRGRFSPIVQGYLGGRRVNGRLGTYAQNRDEFQARFDAIKAYAVQERWQRPGTPPVVEGESGLMLVNMLMPSTMRCLASIDQLELEGRGYAAMSALERFHAATGEYPRTLGELAPKYLSVLPMDPWSGKPLGYVRLDAPDAAGRGYLLYSVGVDGVDDHGHAGAGSGPHYDALSGDPAIHKGEDFIINNPDR